MQPESMVHALEKIRELLYPGGYLIDIHPTGEPAEFIYPFDDRELPIGYLQETDDYIEYRQADEAVAAVVSRGLFQVEKSEEFVFHTHANNFDTLKGFLTENWSDAVLSDEVLATAKKYEWDYGKRPVYLREQVVMRVLRSTWEKGS